MSCLQIAFKLPKTLNSSFENFAYNTFTQLLQSDNESAENEVTHKCKEYASKEILRLNPKMNQIWNEYKNGSKVFEKKIKIFTNEQDEIKAKE